MSQYLGTIHQQKYAQLTQPLFEQLDVAALGSTFLAYFVVCAIVVQTFTGRTCWPGAVASQLPLPTQNTGNSLDLA